MPDHIHLLVTLGSDETLDKLVARIKAVTAGRINRILGRTGPLWARAYHDHALRTDESVEHASRYLIANPVRAGLVDSPWAWPYWSAQWLTSMDDLLGMGEAPHRR